MGLAPRRSDWRFAVAVVSGGHFLSHFYFLALPPLFPLLEAEFALSNAELGLLVSALSVGSLLQLPVGALVDRVGARRVLAAGLALTAGGVALVGVATSYPALLASALVAGLGQSAFHPADYALLETVTDADRQGRSFGVHTFSGFAGFAAAPVVVGTAGLAYGRTAALVAAGAVGLAYAAVVFAGLEPVHRREATPERADVGPADGGPAGGGPADGGPDAGPGLRSSVRAVLDPAILAMVGFFFVMSLAGKGVQTFTGVLAVESFGLSEAAGNATLTGFFTASAVGILLGGVLADRYSPRRILPAGLAVAAGATWLVATRVVPVGATATAGLFSVVGFAVGLVFPSRDRLVSEFAPEGGAGRSFGLVFTGGATASLVGPAVLGALIDATAPPAAFVVVGGCYLLGALVAHGVGSRTATGPATASPADGD